MSDRMESKRFSETVPPGEGVTLTTSLDYEATVEEVRVRFYRGPELDLEVLPFKKSGRDRLSLVDLLGREVVVGDDDYFEFQVSEPVESGDTIGIEVTNTSDEYAYDATVDIVLDQAGGGRRAAQAFLSRLTGWF